MRKILFTLLLIPTLAFSQFYSQCGQDQFVYENFFYKVHGGTFVDIGAHDGVSFSNTNFFEKELDWSGVCVEPIPRVFTELQKNRNSILINGCISTLPGTIKFLQLNGVCEMLSGLVDTFDKDHVERLLKDVLRHACSFNLIDVKSYLLNDILASNNITHVNFLSIDTEGSEYEILSSIDFSRVQIDVITLENDYNDPRFALFLEKKGFFFVKSLGQDMIFVNNNFIPTSMNN